MKKEQLEHLINDDLDEVSKFEVIYQILKDQLRTHQKKLITLKEEQKAEQEERRKSVEAARRERTLSKKREEERIDLELSQFAKHMKPFEFFGV